jgi:hypothetical protein
MLPLGKRRLDALLEIVRMGLLDTPIILLQGPPCEKQRDRAAACDNYGLSLLGQRLDIK